MLSPSRLEKLRCPAHVAFDQLVRADAATIAVALLGTTVHRAVELLLDGAAPDDAWHAACDEIAAKGTDPRSLVGAQRTRLRFCRRSAQLLELIRSIDPVDCLPEEELVSSDGVLGGTADLVLLRESDLVIIDHKTGIVTSEGLPKGAYERQIRIYAGLASERFGRPASRGILMSMREGVVDVDVSDALVERDVAAARAALADYNARVPGEQPGRPAPAVCVWCPHKGRCDAFWSSVTTEWVGEVGECFEVCLTRPPERAANGLGAVGGEAVSGTAARGSHVIVSEIPTAWLDGAAVADVVRVTGVRRRTGTDVYRWTDRSVAEILDHQ